MSPNEQSAGHAAMDRRRLQLQIEQEKKQGRTDIDVADYDNLLDEKLKKCVCVDVLSAASKKTADEFGQDNELIGANNALEILKAVDIMYSMNMEEYT